MNKKCCWLTKTTGKEKHIKIIEIFKLYKYIYANYYNL